MAEARCRLPGGLTPQGVSSIAWALAQLGHHDDAFFADVAQACLPACPQPSSHRLGLTTRIPVLRVR